MYQRAEDKEAKRDAASVINEDDLQMLYLAHLRLSAHMSVSQGVASANSISKQLQESLRRVSPEALADAAAARYTAAAACIEPQILRLPALLDRKAAAAHLGNISHSLLALAAKSAPSAVDVAGGEGGAVGDAGEEALAIDALGRAAAESMGDGDGRLLPSLLSGMRRDVMYRDGDSCEAKLLCKPVAAFAARVQALLREFPEHAILEQLLLVSQRLLSLPLDSPLGRLLAGLELLHRKALEWESYAAKHVSVRDELMAIEAVIMRWHRLEVHAWPDLLVARARRCAQRPSSIFLSMSSVILAAIDGAKVHESFRKQHEKEKNCAQYLQREGVEQLDWRKEVREVARSFLESATLGDFAARLDVMRTLALSLLRPSILGGGDGGGGGGGGGGGDSVGALADAERRRKASHLLTNLALYFAQFAPAVARQLTTQVGPIEREAKGLVTICRWENKDFEALKHNMERSHRQLHKLLTKYDKALHYPVRQLFQQLQDGSLTRFWNIDKPQLTIAASRSAAEPDAAGKQPVGPSKKVRRRRKGRGKAAAKDPLLEVEADELALRRQRAAALKSLLAIVKGAAQAAQGEASARGLEGSKIVIKKGKTAIAPASAVGAATAGEACCATGILEESDLLAKSGLHGASGTMSGDVGAEKSGSFDAEVVEEIVSEMLEDAARLKEEGAARAVKKRALVSWLEELVGLGLSGHASAVPVSRKSLDSLLEGAVDVGRVLPHSFQLPMRMPGIKKKMVIGKQPQQQSAGDYFMRNVALLGRLREAATSVRNMDLSAGEVSKGMGMCEHSIYLTALQREHLAAFSIELIRLHHLAANAAHLVPPVANSPTSGKSSGSAGKGGGGRGGGGGIPPQTTARRKLEATCGLLREASLQLQQIHALHSGACAAARADYQAATGNTSLIAHLSQGIDKIHAALHPHNLSAPDGIDAIDQARDAIDQAHDSAEAGSAVAETEESGRTWTLVSWSAVKAADQALSEVLVLCAHAKAHDSASRGMDAVSRGLIQWVEHVTCKVEAQQELSAPVKSQPVSSKHVQALSAALKEHMGQAGDEALAMTRLLRAELVADTEAAAVAADEPEADSGDEEEGAEGWGMRVVDRHEKVQRLLAWKRLQRINMHLASAQHLLARLSDEAASSSGVKGAAGALAPKGSAQGIAVSEIAQAEVAAMTDQLYRVGAVVGMLAFVGEEATVRATRFHRSCCKLSMVLLGVLTELLANGFCRKPEEAEEGDDIEGVEGMGMGEGEGEKNVSDQIEDEEQLTGAEQEGQQKKDEGSEQKREEGEEAVEMEQDFDGELDDVDKEEEKEDDEEGEDEDKDEVEREMGEVGSDEEQVLDERQGDDDLDENEDKQDDKYEKDNPLKGDEDKMDSEMRGKDDDENEGDNDKDDAKEEERKKEQKKEDGKDGEAEEEEMGSDDEEDEGEKGQEDVEDSHGIDAQAEEGHKLPEEEDALPEDMALDEQEGDADDEDKEAQEGEGEDDKDNKEEGEGEEDAMDEDAVEHEEAKGPETEEGEEGQEEDRARNLKCSLNSDFV